MDEEIFELVLLLNVLEKKFDYKIKELSNDTVTLQIICFPDLSENCRMYRSYMKSFDKYVLLKTCLLNDRKYCFVIDTPYTNGFVNAVSGTNMFTSLELENVQKDFDSVFFVGNYGIIEVTLKKFEILKQLKENKEW